MKVKLSVSRAGPDFVQAPGDVIEVSDAEAGRLVLTDQAECLSSEDKARAIKAAKDAEKNGTSERARKDLEARVQEAKEKATKAAEEARLVEEEARKELQAITSGETGGEETGAKTKKPSGKK